MKKINAGIVGGAGYTGGELLRLLLHHPYISISFIHSRSQAGQPVHSIHADLLGETDLLFSAEMKDTCDVIFLCAGHGEARKMLTETPIHPATRIIDLSHDFRLKASSAIGNRQFVYGLPELNRQAICVAENIANPGCFATAIQLALLPLSQAGWLNEVHTTGITGSTGAGQGLSPTSHFSWRAANIQAYKTLTHQHLGEVLESLHQGQPAFGRLNFIPWRGDFTRGIFTSSVLTCGKPLKEIEDLYRTYYQDHPFTHLSDSVISLKQVVNTNKCVIQLEQEEDRLVVHSAIDNLLKGASGQAVQNMNLMFGLEENTGLQLKASSF